MFEYYSIYKVVDRDIAKNSLPNKLAQVRFFLTAAMYSHKRKIYCIEDLMGDMGGILEIFVFMLEWLIVPISAHSFFMQATKFLFLARIEDPKFFLDPNPKKKLKKWIRQIPNGTD